MDSEILKYIISQLPGGTLSVIAILLFAILAHNSKWIPYKITRVGKNGSTPVTADMLKNHCIPIHEALNLSVGRIVSMADEIKVDNRETRKEIVIIGKKIAVLEERTAHHRRTD